MLDRVERCLECRPWIILSIACAFFALYEAATNLVDGHELEGLSDLVLFAVFLVNFVNRFKAIHGYAKGLEDSRSRGA